MPYDYVLIAIKDQSIVGEIRQDLIRTEVTMGKIIWREMLEEIIEP